MLYTISLKNRFSCCFEPLKKEQISMKFHFKTRKTKLEWLISCLFDELHCSTIFYMICLVFIFQDILFIAPTSSQKSTIRFSTFVTGLKPTSWCLLRPWFKGLDIKLQNTAAVQLNGYKQVPQIFLINFLFVIVVF